MTANGPSTEAHDMRSMYVHSDNHGCPPKRLLYPNSIAGVLGGRKDTSKFHAILRMARLEELYNDPAADFTLLTPVDPFIPDDVFVNMDQSLARHIVKTCTLNRRIPMELLRDNPVSIFITADPPNKLRVSTIQGVTYVNEFIKITEPDVMCSNGILHLTTGIIWPVII